MKKIAALLLCGLALAQSEADANDGVFYAQGNQLIPITETDISVRKEVLTLSRDGDIVEVTVYYEFYNPTGKAKDLLVGFEAAAPYPYEGLGHFPEQPNIHDFRVVMNGQSLSYEVAHVEEWLIGYDKESTPVAPYYINGKVQSWTRQECLDAMSGNDDMSFPFDYVYHFNARFQPGVNTIRHTYKYRMSETVDLDYIFPYVLTAACRWANRQIDDFTLNINMGDRESFEISPTFFQDGSEWTIDGVGKYVAGEWGGDSDVRFHIREGGISFHRKDFRPEGELTVFKPRMIWDVWNDTGAIYGDDVVAVTRSMYIDWGLLLEEKLVFSDEQKRIMKNLPFAQRGYVFKSRELRDYFESTAWYIPDPSYVADMEKLTPAEKKWVQFWMK